MNTAISFIESWAGAIIAWAWPVLWQSSLLIGFLFVMDILLRHRVCAAIRYGFWLLVLVKLLLPPTLAFPSGAGWWLRTSGVQRVASAQANPEFTVRYGSFATPASHLEHVARTDPVVRLSARAIIVLSAVALSLALFGWSVRRWMHFTKQADNPVPLPEEIRRLLSDCINPGTLNRLRIALTDSPVSPAVYGLLRPVIIVPRTLFERFSPDQLKAVLLHEIIHYRRGDVWVNFAQTALQIVFWWHPALWLANSRIRSLREEAVDDAVMTALRDGRETYAPTLLQVARLTLRRPAAVLGLVGILEPSSPLRRRIERLIDYVPPRQKGLGLLSVSFIVVFGALALPMGPRTEQSQGQGNPAAALPMAEKQIPAAASDGSHYNRAEQASNSAAVAQTSNETAAPDGIKLHTRAFKLDLTAVEFNLDALSPTTNRSATVAFRLRDFLASCGFSMQAPSTMFLGNDGRLLIRAPREELDSMEKVIAELMKSPPQIAIKVKLVEIPLPDARAFWDSLGATNHRPPLFLDKDRARRCLADLAKLPGAILLNEGTVTTLSGRQAQLQWVDDISVVSAGSPGSATWVTNTHSVGQTVDIHAHVTQGGTNIQVTAGASQTELLGYDDPGQFVPSASIGTTLALLPLPHFRVREIERVAAVCRDGDTLVLGGAAEFDRVTRPRIETRSTPAKAPSDRDLIVFVTPTIIDAAGNPVHGK